MKSSTYWLRVALIREMQMQKNCTYTVRAVSYTHLDVYKRQLHDVITHYGVIADDSADIVLATDGSRVKYDKDNPRTEVEITALNEPSYKENKDKAKEEKP